MIRVRRTLIALFVTASALTACGQSSLAALGEQDKPSTGPADANLAPSVAGPFDLSYVENPNAQVISEIEIDQPLDTKKGIAVSASIGSPIAVRFLRTTDLDYEIFQRPGLFGAPRKGFVAVSAELRARGIRAIEVYEWDTSGLMAGNYALNLLWYRVFSAGGYTGSPSEFGFEVSLAPP